MQEKPSGVPPLPRVPQWPFGETDSVEEGAAEVDVDVMSGILLLEAIADEDVLIIIELELESGAIAETITAESNSELDDEAVKEALK